jgi:hypothetical protein
VKRGRKNERSLRTVRRRSRGFRAFPGRRHGQKLSNQNQSSKQTARACCCARSMAASEDSESPVEKSNGAAGFAPRRCVRPPATREGRERGRAAGGACAIAQAVPDTRAIRLDKGKMITVEIL